MITLVVRFCTSERFTGWHTELSFYRSIFLYSAILNWLALHQAGVTVECLFDDAVTL